MLLLLLCESIHVCVFTCVHVYIYSDSALWQIMYLMLIGYTNYIMLGLLVICVWHY